MKKLFASMLAATMVAGTAVTALASEVSTFTRNGDFNNSPDYAVIGAYDEDGNKLSASKKVDGGDKLYFPILVSGEELDKEPALPADNMYFANKASEIDDLKASVKDEVGGKYIDDAAIVKKDIKIDNSGEVDGKEIFTADLSGVTAGVTAEVPASVGTASTTVVGGKIESPSIGANLKKSNDDIVINVTGDGADASFDYNGTAVKANSGEVIIGTGADEIKFTPDAAAYTGLIINGATHKVTIERDGYIAAGVKSIDITVDGTTETITGITAENDNAAVLAALDGKVIGDYKVVDVTDSSKVKFEATSAGNKSKATVTVANAATGDGDVAVTEVQDGAGAGTSLGKVYCVEVEMSDYFKNEETEVEFNIQLKSNGRTEFDSEDDAKAANWCADFDLGKDSEIFDLSTSGENVQNGAKATKFKKGDLEIEIGEDTKSLQLDEAITSAGDKEDVDNIFIENDDTIDNAFTFEVKASGQDDLYLELNQNAIKDLAVSNQKADLTFFNFPGEPEFDFSGMATFAVEDEDDDNYFYEIVDGELVETRAKYNEEDGVFELRTNKLGSYVISDKELDTTVIEGEDGDDTEDKEDEVTGGDTTTDAGSETEGDKENANTGAADLIGVASALAVVSIAAAGAVALKK